MNCKVFLYGYTGRKIEELADIVDENKAVVIDVRYSPFSRNKVWDKANLLNRLGSQYIHVKCLGNRNYRNGGAIDIVDLETGIKVIREHLKSHNVMLLCACANSINCHRTNIANRLLDDPDIDDIVDL